MEDEILELTDDSFSDAFGKAFTELGGEGKEFMWQGKKYTTCLLYTSPSPRD